MSHRATPALPAGEHAVLVTTMGATHRADGAARVAYMDLVSADSAAPVILLLHGSPGDHGEVMQLADSLALRARVLVPDLAGFGGSTHDVPDYSFVAHADYLSQLLDSLHVPKVHVVGFSRGGGVALELQSRHPAQVSSVTLLSSIGAQEHELLGDYQLNHALHGAQLAGLWLLRELVPHFGAWDDGMLSVAYARNFYDADQRPLRGILGAYDGPLLILHGRQDPLVPLAAAQEHARLAPQAVLRVYDDESHFMPWTSTAVIAQEILTFATAADRGAAPLRPAGAPRPPATAPVSAPPATGFALVLLLGVIALSTLVSEDLACIGTGLLVARGTVGFFPGTLACFAGILIGDVLLYLAGHVLGRPAVERPPLRWFIDADALTRGSDWFRRRGASVILATRFVPGTRLPTYLAAGVLRVGFWKFTLWCGLAVALWTPLLVGLSALFGEAFGALFSGIQHRVLPGLLLAGAIYLLVRLGLALTTWRGRRLLLSRWRRLARWEFWPMWAFYPPVVLYVAWLALRHRSLTLFTCVNPAIPGGGFAGESKFDILRGLATSPDLVATTERIPAQLTPAARTQAARDAIAAMALSYPVVLKPDVGERGSGVAIIRSDAELERYLTLAGGDVLLQEYVEGVEVGVFYYRIPGESQGCVFAITDKRFPTVTGDGRQSLESLILSDDRAVSMAPFFLHRHAERLDEVLAHGQRLPLVELGTHCRGSAFYDGGRLKTPDLEGAIERLSAGYPGFWFGRYDIRAPSHDAIAAGTGFKVIELNGATSEATSIYDPANGLFDAYRVLFEQWRVLFEIARRNRAAGAQPTSLRELMALLGRHRAALESHVDA
jgi:pimeloyl-ACP methyl ester carboxylesterase/membrane protein DedA with SNARE-associated domain